MLIVVDLAAWSYISTGDAAAVVLKGIPSDVGEITCEWLQEKVADCHKLVKDLTLLRSCVQKIVRDFEAKGASVTVRFVAELREQGEIKTPKCPRDLDPLDPERFARLGAAQRKKKQNLGSVMDWWRECCRGPEGWDWLALSAAVQWAAVNHVFAEMGE